MLFKLSCAVVDVSMIGPEIWGMEYSNFTEGCHFIANAVNERYVLGTGRGDGWQD